MLGKTNITAIKESTTVTDIEDLRWKPIKIDGVNSDFVKAVYGNNMLVAITRDGTIVSTTDGENWKKTRIETEGSYELEDIIWTGSQYVMVGNRKEIVTEEKENTYKYHGIIVISEQLIDFSIEEDGDNTYSRYYAAIKQDEKLIIISKEYKNDIAWAGVYAVVKDSNGILKQRIILCEVRSNAVFKDLNNYKIIVAKKNSGGAVYVEDNHAPGVSIYRVNRMNTTLDWINYSSRQITLSETARNRAFSVFECKDSLFYYDDTNHNLKKILDNNSYVVVSQNKEFFFIDAIYFNRCEIFLNGHNMLVIKSGDSMEDKTLEDLIEITYDFEMRFVEKAFGGLYIWGTEGNILVSSDEVKDEEVIAVKTMSAVKALYDAKIYTDERYAALEARIIELENLTDLTAN